MGRIQKVEQGTVQISLCRYRTSCYEMRELPQTVLKPQRGKRTFTTALPPEHAETYSYEEKL